MKIKKLLLGLLFSLSVIGCTTSNSSSSTSTTTSNTTNTTVSSSSISSSSSTLSGEALKLKLRQENQQAHTYQTSYGEIRYLFKDSDKGDTGKMRLFYTHEEIVGTWDQGTSYNREHVWPQSKGWFNKTSNSTKGAGGDLHHIRPTRPSTNGDHSDKRYGEVNEATASVSKANGYVGGYYTSQYYEPMDFTKGDVARILFYLLVRYSESDKYKITDVAQSMEVLLTWNKLDPVDSLEMYRNDYIETIQGNRNPFIDNPEYADLIWG